MSEWRSWEWDPPLGHRFVEARRPEWDVPFLVLDRHKLAPEMNVAGLEWRPVQEDRT